MTTLYRPVLIESVEQAEALPPGTIAIPSDHRKDCADEQAGPSSPSVRLRCYEPGYTWHSDWDGAHNGDDLVGWTALVPIEAAEQTSDRRRLCDPEPDIFTRYVTPWTQETQS